MDYISIFLDLWQRHRGKILGILIGLLVGIGFAIFGFWRTLVLAVCIFVGYYVGRKLDAKENLFAFLDKFKDERQ